MKNCSIKRVILKNHQSKQTEIVRLQTQTFQIRKANNQTVFVQTRITFAYMLAVKKKLILPCLIETYLAFEAATKLACGKESSNENSSSLVTELDLVLRTARDPMGAKYWPLKSRRAI